MRSVKLDNTELNGSIGVIDNLIDSFDEIELSMYTKVMGLKDIWNDGYTSSFYEAIENEKNNFDVLIQDLRKFNNIYKFIYKKSTKYGDRIQVDYTNAHNIHSKYNSCNQKFYSIDSLYSNLDLSHCSEVASEIQSQKAKFRNTQRYLDRYVDKLNDAIDDIKNMEYDVITKTLDLDIFGIESINYGEMVTYNPDTRLVGMSSTEDIETAINNINATIQDEEDVISNINSEFVTIRSHYISNLNNKKLSNKQSDFNCQFKTLKNNHENMIMYINKLKETYLKLTKETTAKVSKEIEKV